MWRARERWTAAMEAGRRTYEEVKIMGGMCDGGSDARTDCMWERR